MCALNKIRIEHTRKDGQVGFVGLTFAEDAEQDNKELIANEFLLLEFFDQIRLLKRCLLIKFLYWQKLSENVKQHLTEYVK